jgi:hypothetical protein
LPRLLMRSSLGLPLSSGLAKKDTPLRGCLHERTAMS